MAIVGVVAARISMGRIERVAGCCVATRFWIPYGAPVRAYDSFIDPTGLNGGAPIPISRNRRSVAAGFLRVWATILAVGATVVSVTHLVVLVLAALLWALSAYMWFFFGRLSPSEVRRRLAYATWLGVPYDPAYLSADTDPPCMAALTALVDERTAHAPAGYRAQLPEPWRAAVLDSNEPDLLIAALARARLERRRAGPDEKAELDALHAALWAKLDPLLAAGDAPRAFLDWQAYVAQREKRERVEPRQAITLALMFIGCVTALIFGMRYASQPTLAIANVSGADGLTVLLDGKPVAARLPTARRESDAFFVTKRVEPGEHELLARDAGGTVIDRRRLTMTEDHPAFLYVPGRAPGICFFRELVTYAEDAPSRGYDIVRLDPTETLSPFEREIDYWFEEAPERIETSQGSSPVTRRTVRAMPCSKGAAP